MELKPVFPVHSQSNPMGFYSYYDSFSEEELGWINNLQKLYDIQKASIGEFEDEDTTRKSDIKWLHYSEKTDWVYSRLANIAMMSNKEMWQFDIPSILDTVQYTQYYENGGHYGWHTDTGPYPYNTRKISITVQLSDPDEYKGGDLELMFGNNVSKMPKEKGCAVLFPSYILHRITPVTKGIRKSLVLWVGGSVFK
jgi:PKHD-type hydroxylase